MTRPQSPPGNAAAAAPDTPSGAATSRYDGRLAVLAYLSVPFTLFLVPLGVYLCTRRGHPSARWHAAQACLLAVTALLYTVCGLIVGAVLALDSLQVATLVTVPLLALLWLSVLVAAVRAAQAASRGELRPVPRWLRLARERPVSR